MISKGQKSVFSGKSTRPHVQVATGNGPYDNTRAVLAGLDLRAAAGKKVLLKPNAGRIARSGSGIVTHAAVVCATMDAFLDAGAEVAVGESPIVGVNALEALEAMDLVSVAEKKGCRLIDMDLNPARRVPVRDGAVLSHLDICPEVFEHDFVVSIPVMKTHMHTGVTLSVKNMKGCLWRRSKVKLHMLPPVEGSDEKPIDIAIADLSTELLPDLAVIDGTVCMEGLGPSAGNARELDVVVAGSDALAVDAVACALMGMDVADVPHLRMSAERGCGVIDLSRIDVEPENWRELCVEFERPPSDISIEFPGITVLDSNSCSACQSTVFLFLKHYADELVDYFPPGTNVRIAIGKGHKELPEGTICVGNCTARHRDRGTYVPGCPPVSSEILSKLSGKPTSDTRDGRMV